MEAAELFENAMAWLRRKYDDVDLEYEDDVVEEVEARINREIKNSRLPYRVELEYSVLPNTRADLVILSPGGEVEVVVEFKYEPDSGRYNDEEPAWEAREFWDRVLEDIRRISRYVEEGSAVTAYAVFIDGGGTFHDWPHIAPRGSKWVDWGHGRWVLWTQAVSD